MSYPLNLWTPITNWRDLPSYGGIYLLRNRTTLKEYVGKAVDLSKRVREHLDKRRPNLPLYRSMAKHGFDKFEVCLLHVVSTKGITLKELREVELELFRLEIETIDSRNTLHPTGYNLTAGGEGISGIPVTDETKAKISKANYGRVHSDEARQKMSIGHLGFKHTPETLLKMSKAQTGRIRTPETLVKMSLAQKGKKFSEERKEVMKQTARRNIHRYYKGVFLWEFNASTPKYFESVSLAASYLNTSISNLSGWCHGLHTAKLTFAVAYAD